MIQFTRRLHPGVLETKGGTVLAVTTASAQRGQSVNTSGRSRLDLYFKITERGSSLSTEVRAGVITWLAMCYILFLNPTILSGKDHAGHILGFTSVLTVTALVAGVMTIAMGVIGKAPLGLATGLGINAFVAYSLVESLKLSWPDAMGVVVTEGLLMVLLTFVNDIREKVLNAIPLGLRSAIAVGIGAFILMVGLVNAGVVVKGDGTLVGMAPRFIGWPLFIFLFGLIVTSAFVAAGKKAALLYGIVLTTIFATIVNTADNFHDITDGSARIPHSFPAPNFHLVGAFSFHYWTVLGTAGAIAVVVALTMSDFFDNAGTTYGIFNSAGLLNADKTLPNARAILGIDALAAVAGGFCSASSSTTYIESASGVESGGRTGLTAVVTGVLFLASMVIAPVAGIVPSVATAPVLVIVAAFMFRKVREIDVTDFPTLIAAVGAVFGMAFTYSITNGIGYAIVLYTAVSLLTWLVSAGAYRLKVHLSMVVVSAIFCWYFWHGIGA